jgi:hypothetical protein
MLFFGAARIPGMGKGIILAMNVGIYVVLTLILVLVIVANQNFDLQYMLVLAGLIALSIISLLSKVFYRAKKPQT